MPLATLPKQRKRKDIGICGEKPDKIGLKPEFIVERGQTFPIYAKAYAPWRTSYTAFAENRLQSPDKKKKSNWKTNKAQCKQWVNHFMQRIPDRNTVLKQIKDFDTPSNREAYYQYWKTSERIVNDEVDLALLTNRIRLKFTPRPVHGDRAKPGFIRGEYHAMVEREDGTTKTFAVATNWVEQHFTAEALAIVQQIEKETKETFKDKFSARTESGYLSLEKEVAQQRKVSGKVVVDTRQISKLRYLPGKMIRRANGNMRWHPELWKGVIKNPTSQEVEYVELTPEWVALNISPEFQTMLKELRDPKTEGYVLIPEGSNEAHEEGTVQFLDNAPPAKYWNKSGNPRNKRCVIDSVASGLYHLGHISLAKRIAEANGTNLLCGMEFFCDIITNYSTKEERKLFVLVRLKKGILSNWDTLVDAKKYRLCMLGIASSDGKTDHAICVVGDWVFDSNFEKALPLSKETLDICASSAERETHYVKATRGYLLRDRYNYKLIQI